MKKIKKLGIVLLTMAFFFSVAGTVCAEEVNTVNINTATKEELTTLDGVGPVIAERIIEYRETIEKFKKAEDIMNVKGVGQAIFEKNKQRIITEVPKKKNK
jgi:competence protein ComEA